MESEQTKQQLNVDAQILKDRLIDTILKLANDFSQDWNRIMTKLAAINKEIEESDKLNKK